MKYTTFDKAFKAIERIEGWFTRDEASVLYPFVRNLIVDSHMVEVGTWKGRSTTFFHLINPFIKITTVDIKDRGFKHEHVEKKIMANDMYAHELIMANQKADFVFIVCLDACHDYEAVKEDIATWEVLTRLGGHIAFHDYEPKHPEVMRAVDEWLENNQSFEVVAKANHILIAKRI